MVCSALHKETGTTRAIKELKKSKKNKAKNDLLLKVRRGAAFYTETLLLSVAEAKIEDEAKNSLCICLTFLLLIQPSGISHFEVFGPPKHYPDAWQVFEAFVCVVSVEPGIDLT